MLWTALAGVRSAKTCQLSALRMTQDVECLCTTMYKLAPGLLSVSQCHMLCGIYFVIVLVYYYQNCFALLDVKLMLKTLT